MFIIINAMVVFVVVMQYAGDIMITNISGYIKQILLLALPFVAGKYKLFYRKAG